MKEEVIFYKENGRKATYEELANKLNININRIKNCYKVMGQQKVSLNETIDGTEDVELITSIVSEDPSVEEQFIKSNSASEIRNFIELLPLNEREKIVFEKRFGYNNNKILSLDELGDLLNVSRERARQIEEKVLIKFFESEQVWDICQYTEEPNKSYKIIEDYRLTRKLPIINRKIFKKDGK